MPLAPGGGGRSTWQEAILGWKHRRCGRSALRTRKERFLLGFRFLEGLLTGQRSSIVLPEPDRGRRRTAGAVASHREQEAGPAGLQGGRRRRRFEVPRLETVKRVARPGRLTQREAMTSCYILQTAPHPVEGNAYVVLTDHRDAAYLEPLERLAKHHAGTLLRVDDLGTLADPSARAALAKQLVAAKPRYVAVAPRLESFRENMLLGLWDILATLDADPELDALPGLLVAPDAASFAALVDRSIAYRPTARSAFHPFVISQLVDGSPNGSRSLQKLGILRERFGQVGAETPGLVVRHSPGDQPRLEGKDIWEAHTRGPRTPLAEFPGDAANAINDASLVVMFGHGVPGMACGLKVEAFDNLVLTNKVILCGSCFSAAPTNSDFPKMAVGPDGSAVVADRKRFVMEAVEHGAVVAIGHMRTNAGFPHLYPVLDSLLHGETVGEAYQRLIDGLLEWTQLDPDELVPHQGRAPEAAPEPGAGFGPGPGGGIALIKCNQLLYVLIGDPALARRQPLAKAAASRPRTGQPPGPRTEPASFKSTLNHPAALRTTPQRPRSTAGSFPRTARPSQRGEAAIRGRRPCLQLGEPIEVRRPLARPGPRSPRVPGPPGSEPDVRQVAERVAAGEGLAGAGQHRHAHPERLAGRQAARVGKRVERHVDPVVGGQQLRRRRRRPRSRAASALIPCFREQVDVSRSGTGVVQPAILEHEPRPGDAARGPPPRAR